MSQGEVWLVNLDPTIGDEIRKTRPAVIVSRDAIGILALRVIVPITGWQPQFKGCDWLVRLDPDDTNGLDKPSLADTLQVRSVSTRRLVRRLGEMSSPDFRKILQALAVVFDLPDPGN
jgi:mRNA interferase MazF